MMRYLLFSLSVLLFVACNNEKVSTFTLEGQIENPERNFLLLQQESNIEKKETTFIDTIFLDAAGKFKESFNEEPHFYRLIVRSEEHTSELQSRPHLVCRLLLEKK